MARLVRKEKSKAVGVEKRDADAVPKMANKVMVVECMLEDGEDEGGERWD